jgi:hypothetical protein
MAGDKPGPEPLLTKEKFREIRECVFEDKSLRGIAETCGFSETSFYTWHSDNYLGLADKITMWRREYLFNLGEKNLKDIMKLGVADKGVIKSVADISKYVTSTLGNKVYKTRTEVENTITVNEKDKGKAVDAINDFLETKDEPIGEN